MTLLSNPLPTPLRLLIRPLKNCFYRHIGVSEVHLYPPESWTSVRLGHGCPHPNACSSKVSRAAIPSVSLVQLGHTNRSVFLSHKSQRETALVYALSRPIPYCPTRRSGGRKMGLCFTICVFLTFHGPLASHGSNPYPSRSRVARYNATKVPKKS